MENKNELFTAWIFFAGQVITTAFSVLLARRMIPYTENQGGLASILWQPYILAVVIAGGTYIIYLYKRSKTRAAIRYIYPLFAFTAFYYAANILFSFSPPNITFLVNFFISFFMSTILFWYYIFSKTSQ